MRYWSGFCTEKFKRDNMSGDGLIGITPRPVADTLEEDQCLEEPYKKGSVHHRSTDGHNKV
jgi:hypothetical protein